jgi:hypothetical protein
MIEYLAYAMNALEKTWEHVQNIYSKTEDYQKKKRAAENNALNAKFLLIGLQIKRQKTPRTPNDKVEE